MRGGSGRLRGNAFKLEEYIFRLEIRKKFFTVMLLRHWNGLYSEVVDAPSLEALKARLDEALSSLVQIEASMPIAGGLELDDLKGSFQPKLFYDSMILFEVFNAIDKSLGKKV